MKKILIITGAVLLTAVVVTFSLVHWNNKLEATTAKAKEKIEIVKKADPDLSGHTSADSMESADSPGDTDSSSHPESVVEAETSTPSSQSSTQTVSTANSEEPIVEAQGKGVPASVSEISLEEMKAAYREAFTELEAMESSKVDQVVVQAKADFVSKKYAKDELIAKYQELAELLENNADKTFNAYYKQLQLNLEKYGYDVNEAIPFKNEYNAKKQERMIHIINELSQF